jgi:hypothetical protein
VLFLSDHIAIKALTYVYSSAHSHCMAVSCELHIHTPYTLEKRPQNRPERWRKFIFSPGNTTLILRFSIPITQLLYSNTSVHGQSVYEFSLAKNSQISARFPISKPVSLMTSYLSQTGHCSWRILLATVAFRISWNVQKVTAFLSGLRRRNNIAALLITLTGQLWSPVFSVLSIL